MYVIAFNGSPRNNGTTATLLNKALDVQLPEPMQRAMAAQAEAERDRKAKVVHADGEFQASEKLAQAAAILAQQPAALQLRYLGTLKEIATERTNMVIFPIPIDLFSAFLGERLGT